MKKKDMLFVVAVSAILFVAVPMLVPILVQGQGVITKKALSSDAAVAVARGAIESCRASGGHSAVSVVDGSGLLMVFIRDDGASPLTIDLSRRKAYTALIYRRPSAETAKLWAAQMPTPMPNIPEATGSAGGVPIKVGNEVIAAVGVSGGNGTGSDEPCANAGIAKIADQLK